jgi:GT2 family glycosyltransferase
MSPFTPSRSAAEPVVSVVVPTYRRGPQVLRLLNALAAQADPGGPFEVVVVDDCSSDGTLEQLGTARERLPFPLTVLSTGTNSGPAGARNVGWRHARAALLAFTDDDCVPTTTWLSAGTDALRRNPQVGIVQGPVAPPPDTNIEDLPPWNHMQRIDAPSPYFEACNVFYRRSALEAVGGFDERWARWGEDTAAGWSVLEAGWGRVFDGRALVYHDVSIRNWRWWARMGYAERANVVLAARHPGLRAEAFWRPWALRPDDAAFAAAVAGIILAHRWRPALLLCLPYATLRRPSVRRLSREELLRTAQKVAVDACRSAGHIAGAVATRRIVV